MTRVHVVHIWLHVSCTHNRMAEKIIQYQIYSCKQQLVAC